MSDFFKLKEIDRKMYELTSKVSYVTFNPINLQEEQGKVLADPDYDPQFQYAQLPFDPIQVQESLANLDMHDSSFGKILEMKRNESIDKIEMVANTGNRKFSIYSKKAYGLPSEKTLRKAAEFLNLESDKEERTIPAKKALHMINSEMLHFGFDYKMGVREMSATASVLATSRVFWLRKGFMFSPNYVKRLLIHEIGTHVLRSENGREQPFKMFVQGFPNYLPTEEGLAVWNEERFGLLLKENLRNYAARVVAVKMAQTSSFSKVYNHMRQYFSDKWAYRLTARVKRGLIDTSQPGGATRDYSYLEGYLKVKKFLDTEEHSLRLERLKTLYMGKMSLECFDLVKDIPGLMPAKHLPKNQSFKNLLSF